MAVRQVYTCERCGMDFDEVEHKKTAYDSDTYYEVTLEIVEDGFACSVDMHLCANCHSQLCDWFAGGERKMTRLENALQDPRTREFIMRAACPNDLLCIKHQKCPKKHPGLEDCKACWNMEYTEKDGEENDNQ